MSFFRVLVSAVFIVVIVLAGAPVFAQQITLPLWSHGAPEPTTLTGPERDATLPTDKLIGGRKIIKLTNVTEPTLTVYMSGGKSGVKSGVANSPAVLVFPGGAYQLLAYDLEGTEVCDWLNSIHVTCVLVKYRVPYEGHYPERSEDLEDAQQAMRLTRVHAAEWGIDAKRVGALGFSAGGHLVTVLSNHFDFAPLDAARAEAIKQHGGADASISARPDFAFVLYPGYLVHWPDKTSLAPEAVPSGNTPPTFLLQAEDDMVHEENSLVYFQALKEAGVPAELHIYADGGHGYGLRPTEQPVTHWPNLAETWLRTIHILPGN